MAGSAVRRVMALALIVAVVAMAVTTPVWSALAYIYVLPIALTSALIVGAPALSLAARRRWTRLYQWVSLGAIAGALPFVILGMVTSLIAGRIDRPASSFYRVYEPLAIGIGIISSVIYWLGFVRTRRSGDVTIAWIGVLLAGAVAFGIGVTSSNTRTIRSIERMSLSWSYGSAVDAAGTPEIRLWRADHPQCVASLILPAVAEYVRRDHPSVIDVEIIRISRYQFQDDVRLVRLGPIQVPPMLTGSGCWPWQTR